jgi:hypothetical protein
MIVIVVVASFMFPAYGRNIGGRATLLFIMDPCLQTIPEI